MRHNDKVLIIKHVFIVVWNISSLEQVLLKGLKWLRNYETCVPRGMTSLRQVNMGNVMKKKIVTSDFTFYLNTNILAVKFSCRISIKKTILCEVLVDPFIYNRSHP